MSTETAPLVNQPPQVYGVNTADFIRDIELHPCKEIIKGMLHEDENVVIHGAEESFKTILSLMLAGSLATGTPFLGIWQVVKPRRVFFFETEMHPKALAQRVAQMWQGHREFQLLCDNLYFATEAELRHFQRTSMIAAKMEVLKMIAESRKVHTIILDTANPCFRGKENPDKDTDVGQFFDSFESIKAALHICVRHNHRVRVDDPVGDPASHIRGSSEWIGRPDFMMEMKRTDKRLHLALLTVSKFRYGSKPEPIELWFDAQDMILISYPPVIHLLSAGPPQTRADLIAGFRKRFNAGQSKADELIQEALKADWVTEAMRGHSKIFEINYETLQKTDWYLRYERYGSI